MFRPRRILRKRLHQTPLVILHLLNPIRLPRGNQNMSAVCFDMPIQRFRLINLELGILDSAVRTVLTTIRPILLWPDSWKDVFRLPRGTTKREQRTKHGGRYF